MIGKLATWSLFDQKENTHNVSNIIWQFVIAYCNDILVLVSIWYDVLVARVCATVQVIQVIWMEMVLQLVMPVAVVVLVLLALILCLAGIAWLFE